MTAPNEVLDLAYVPIGDIQVVDGHNPRDVAEASKEFVANVKQHGILQPLIVTPGTNGTRQLVAGHRRLDAAKQAGLEQVPCITIDVKTELAAHNLATIENLQRQDLTPMEEGKAFEKALLTMTEKDLSKAVNVSVDTIRNRVALLRLPEAVQAKVGGDLLPLKYVGQVAAVAEKSPEVAAAVIAYAEEKAKDSWEPFTPREFENDMDRLIEEATTDPRTRLPKTDGPFVVEFALWRRVPTTLFSDQELVELEEIAGVKLTGDSYGGPSLEPKKDDFAAALAYGCTIGDFDPERGGLITDREWLVDRCKLIAKRIAERPKDKTTGPAPVRDRREQQAEERRKEKEALPGRRDVNLELGAKLQQKLGTVTTDTDRKTIIRWLVQTAIEDAKEGAIMAIALTCDEYQTPIFLKDGVTMRTIEYASEVAIRQDLHRQVEKAKAVDDLLALYARLVIAARFADAQAMRPQQRLNAASGMQDAFKILNGYADQVTKGGYAEVDKFAKAKKVLPQPILDRLNSKDEGPS